jgi:hypothetical protein
MRDYIESHRSHQHKVLIISTTKNTNKQTSAGVC